MATVNDKFAAGAAFTITLNSLANSTAGVGRQSTIIDNTTNLYLSALVSVAIKMGTTPTAGGLVYVYLIRDDNDLPIIDDNGGASDAAITIVNAPLLGVLLCPSATTGIVLSRTFDTSQLGPLGPKWGIAIVNGSGVALSSSGHTAEYTGRTQTVA
jgi:hypothetical protein